MKKTIQNLIIILAVLGVMVIGMVLSINTETAKYNDGICPKCGGHYHVAAMSRGSLYVYECDTCYNSFTSQFLLNK